MKKVYLFAGLLGLAASASAQVKLGNTPGTPDPSASLQLEQPNQAIYLNRVSLTSTTDATTVPNPKAGMMVYNVNAAITGNSTNPASQAGAGVYYYNGSAWVPASAAAASTGGAWSLTGNAGTIDGANFIGTTDDVPLTLRVNNAKAGRIEDAGGNTAFGFMSQAVNAVNTTTNEGIFNTSVGGYALAANTIGRRNAAFGYNALGANTVGDSNTAVGFGALAVNTLGYNNTAFGGQALDHNTIGKFNTAMGYDALHFNVSDSGLTAVGAYALYNNNTGRGNTATGFTALFANVTGSGNTANGVFALRSSLTGNYNTAMGSAAGARSGALGSGGNNNVFIGFAADSSNISGNGITAVGYLAGLNNTGSNNTFLGSNAGTFAALTNAAAIGANATVCISNGLALGATDAGSTTTQSANVGINVCDPTQRIDFRNGHIRNRQDNLPVVSVTAANGITAATIAAGSSDVRGNIGTVGYNNISTLTNIRINFAYAATNPPIVTITPANENASTTYWFVTSDVNGFNLYFRAPYTGMMPSGTPPAFNYQVIE